MIDPGKLSWAPILDLPLNAIERLASRELASLAPIWREQAERLRDSNAQKIFNERLKREWAIETGILEGLYSIDRGTTELLIERGLEASLVPFGSTDKPPEIVVAILRDQKDVLEGLFDFVAQRRSLSTSYIKEIHVALTNNQRTTTAQDQFGRIIEVQLLRGEWKQHPNNPTRPDGVIHYYCPPEHVSSEMDRLIHLHHTHETTGVPPEIEAAWLHHRFTQIHPFQDGNGRVARALASLVFLRAGWFPLVVHRDLRAEYISALEEADAGNLDHLVALFSQVQKKSFLSALSISTGVLEETVPIRQVITAAVERLKAKLEGNRHDQERVFRLASELEALAYNSLNGVRDELQRSLVTLGRPYSVFADRADEQNIFWFNRDIIDVAKKLKYFADTRKYKNWLKLTIREERQTNIVISFHSIGTQFVGVLGASAFISFRDYGEGGEPKFDGPYPLNEEVFQFAFNEDLESVKNRFDKWLSRVLVAGLEQWRRQL